MLSCTCRWPAAPLSGSRRWARRGCPRGRGRRSSGRTGRRTTRAGTCRSHADLCMLLSEANEDIHSADMRKFTQARLSEFVCRSHGVVVNTLDFESRNPSSNLGGTLMTMRIVMIGHPCLLLPFMITRALHAVYFIRDGL